jgi:dihydrofolate reductase
MGKVLVVNHVTLDGVMQAPAGPDEDPRGGFGHGGWAAAGSDDVMAAKMAEGMARGAAQRRAGRPGGLLLGRRTYESFYGVWPTRTDNPFTEVLNETTKYVVSRTLPEPLPWVNSVLLGGDATSAVAELKNGLTGDLTILGSGELIGSLMAADLIDEYLLMIHPLVLGTGRRLFPDGVHAPLRLTDSVITTTGVVIATYEPLRAQ